MESSVDFTPPASSAHMKEQTCFIKHVKANTQDKKKHAAQRRLCEHEYRETIESRRLRDQEWRLLINPT